MHGRERGRPLPEGRHTACAGRHVQEDAFARPAIPLPGLRQRTLYSGNAGGGVGETFCHPATYTDVMDKRASVAELRNDLTRLGESLKAQAGGDKVSVEAIYRYIGFLGEMDHFRYSDGESCSGSSSPHRESVSGVRLCPEADPRARQTICIRRRVHSASDAGYLYLLTATNGDPAWLGRCNGRADVTHRMGGPHYCVC